MTQVECVDEENIKALLKIILNDELGTISPDFHYNQNGKICYMDDIPTPDELLIGNRVKTFSEIHNLKTLEDHKKFRQA